MQLNKKVSILFAMRARYRFIWFGAESTHETSFEVRCPFLATVRQELISTTYDDSDYSATQPSTVYSDWQELAKVLLREGT